MTNHEISPRSPTSISSYPSLNLSSQSILSGRNSQRKVNKKHFAPEEDMLIIILHQEGKSYEEIAHSLVERKPKNVKEHYDNYLPLGINHGPFTKEEDQLLLNKVNELGNQWSKIQAHFPQRTDNQLRSRWLSLTKSTKSEKN